MAVLTEIKESTVTICKAKVEDQNGVPVLVEVDTSYVKLPDPAPGPPSPLETILGVKQPEAKNIEKLLHSYVRGGKALRNKPEINKNSFFCERVDASGVSKTKVEIIEKKCVSGEKIDGSDRWFKIVFKEEDYYKKEPTNTINMTVEVNFDGWMIGSGVVGGITMEQFIEYIKQFEAKNLKRSLNDKITFLRQASHEEDTPFEPVIARKEELKGELYIDGEMRNVPFYLNNRKCEQSMWQYIMDYEQVLLKNGEMIDLHHLFIGLDVLPNKVSKGFKVKIESLIPSSIFKTLLSLLLESLLNFPLPLDNNYSAATWAGDIGSAVAECFLEYNIDYWQKRNPTPSENEKIDYYYNSRAPKHDLLSDIYALGMYNIIQIKGSKINLSDVLKEFNNNITKYEISAFKSFFIEYGFTLSKPLKDKVNSAAVLKLYKHISSFAFIWIIKRAGTDIENLITIINELLNLIQQPIDSLNEFLDKVQKTSGNLQVILIKMCNKFVGWLETYREKYFTSYLDDNKTVMKKGDFDTKYTSEHGGIATVPGYYVYDLQMDLKNLGFIEVGNPDGYLGSSTENALATFQYVAKSEYRGDSSKNIKKVVPGNNVTITKVADGNTLKEIKLWKDNGYKKPDLYGCYMLNIDDNDTLKKWGGIIRKNDPGKHIEDLQKDLLIIGYWISKVSQDDQNLFENKEGTSENGMQVSGKYDEYLKGAVYLFQLEHGLSKDGVVGLNTAYAIKKKFREVNDKNMMKIRIGDYSYYYPRPGVAAGSHGQFYQLPPLNYYSRYSPDYANDYKYLKDIWGIKKFIELVIKTAEEWKKKKNDIITVGDIALITGGPITGHHGHESGEMADIYSKNYCQLNNNSFDKKKSVELAELFLENGANRILFNCAYVRDKVNANKGEKILAVEGHGTHFHVTFADKRVEHNENHSCTYGEKVDVVINGETKKAWIKYSCFKRVKWESFIKDSEGIQKEWENTFREKWKKDNPDSTDYEIIKNVSLEDIDYHKNKAKELGLDQLSYDNDIYLRRQYVIDNASKCYYEKRCKTNLKTRAAQIKDFKDSFK